MNSKYFSYALITTLLVLSMMTSFAQTTAPAAPVCNIGVVSLGQVGAGFSGYKLASDRITAYYKVRQEITDNLRKGEFLTQSEYKEYIKYVGNSTVINPVRVKELQDKAEKQSKRYAELKERETPTELTAKEVDEFNLIDYDNATNFKLFLDRFNSSGNRINSLYGINKDIADYVAKGEFLSQKDFKEYLLTPNLTAERLKELQGISAERSKRYNELRQRAYPVPLNTEDAAEYATLIKDDGANSQTIMERFNKYKKEGQDEEKRLSKTIEEFQKACIAKVTQKNNLVMVISQDVVANNSLQNVVLLGGVDITKEVIELMNKDFKPELLDEKK